MNESFSTFKEAENIENPAEIIIGVIFLLSITGAYYPALGSCCCAGIFDKRTHETAQKYFGKKGGGSFFDFTYKAVLLRRFPLVCIPLLVIFPTIIFVSCVLAESTVFLDDPSEANTGHYIGEAFYFTSIYFIGLAITSFSFPLVQYYIYRRNKDRLFSRYPFQYQDRFYTACGVPAYAFYNFGLLFLKINSSEILDQDLVDNLLIADLCLPLALITRCKHFIDGYHLIFASFQYTAMNAGGILFPLIHYVGLFIGIIFAGLDTLPVLVVLVTFYVLFLIVPNLILLYFFKVIHITSENVTNPTPKSNVTKDHLISEKGDFYWKEVKVEGLQDLGSVGLRNIVFYHYSRFTLPFYLYVTEEENEESLAVQFIVTRRVKSSLKNPFVSISFFFGFIFFFVFLILTGEGNRKQLPFVMKDDPKFAVKVFVGPPSGRYLFSQLFEYSKFLFVVDSAGIEGGLAFYLRVSNSLVEEEKEVAFVWMCTEFEEVIAILKVKDTLEKEAADKIKIIIHCNLLRNDEVDMLLKHPDYPSLVLNKSVKLINLNVDDVFTDTNDLSLISVGSSRLSGNANILSKKLNAEYFDLIYETKFTKMVRSAQDKLPKTNDI